MADLAEPAATAPFTINTFGPPAHKPPIRCSPAHAEEVRRQIQELTEAHLVVHEATPWASPCFLVAKPNSTKMRLVIDYRLLNLQTIRDSHPIPHIRDILMKVAQFMVYSKTDLMSGFWQIAMEEGSVKYTGVCTSDTLFTWRRMPFGVRNGPPCFQRAMSQGLLTH